MDSQLDEQQVIEAFRKRKMIRAGALFVMFVCFAYMFIIASAKAGGEVSIMGVSPSFHIALALAILVGAAITQHFAYKCPRCKKLPVLDVAESWAERLVNVTHWAVETDNCPHCGVRLK